MLKRLTAIIAAVLPVLSFAQTKISGVVNNYYKVAAMNTTQNTVQLSSTTGLAANDKVMIIQMKGATISTNTNNGTFGNITGINSAGNYEINTVCSISGSTVYLMNALYNTNYSIADKVQLVRIPTYTAADVIDSLKAAPWDSTAGTGGVLAINVTGALTLHAPVSASAKGFVGGLFLLSGGTCFDNIAQADVYNPTSTNPQMGAYKGEGLADVSVADRGGRAALATGGGGGNNHNTGGAGGSNAGAGGNGGINTSSGSNCSSNFPGKGAGAVSNNNAKLFLGGGGGAGHGNNTVTPQYGGGAGGGIVFIQAASLTSNGYTISANGGDGSGSTGDGASGGGAGGSVLLKITNYTDQSSITANGGNGGTVDNEAIQGRCFGEGGGGGGGKIYFTGASQGSSTVSGGAKGLKINSPSCADAGSGTAGAAGIIAPNVTIAQSSTISSFCVVQAPLPVHLLTFKAVLHNRSVYIDWEVSGEEDAAKYIIQRSTTGGWTDLKTIPASAAQSSYQTTDANLATGTYQYRLQIIEKTGVKVYSDIRSVQLKDAEAHMITLSPNPAAKEVVIIGPANGLLQIFDLAGRLLLEKTLSGTGSIRQDVTQWQPGMYMVRINGATEKLLIQK